MEKFTSEVLPSGIKAFATGSEFRPFGLESSTGNCVYLTKSDINRLHGIAFPEKRHGSCTNIIRCMAESCEQEAVCVMEDGRHLCSDCQLSFVEK